MKHWNLKSFMAGMLVTALAVGVGVPALAAARLEMQELYYNNIQIRLNGKALEPKDVKGNVVEPFAFNGTTYLPVRAVGEALGLNVGWDGKTQTVILGDDPQYQQPAAWLQELDTFEGNLYTDSTPDSANDGSTYERAISSNSGASWYNRDYSGTWLLKGQYGKLTGTLYLSEESKDSSEPYSFQVFADDELIYTSPDMKAGVEPVPFSVDLSNCYKLRIDFKLGYGGRLGDVALWK